MLIGWECVFRVCKGVLISWLLILIRWFSCSSMSEVHVDDKAVKILGKEPRAACVDEDTHIHTKTPLVFCFCESHHNKQRVET